MQRPRAETLDWKSLLTDWSRELLETELAQRLASGPTQSLARIKDAMNRAAQNDLSQQLDIERDFQRELGRTEDFREGVTAFLAKRKAEFKGK